MSCMDNDNLISLGKVQEDNILKELQSRYSNSQIYVSQIQDVSVYLHFLPFLYIGEKLL